MKLWLILHVGLAVGPSVHPLTGATITEAERELLPSGGHAGSVADLWVMEWVNLRPAGGGLALFDSPALAARGWSWTETRYRLNGSDITDPARSGAPLVQVPHGLWQRTGLTSLWTDSPTVDWHVDLEHSEPAVHAGLGWGRQIGGGTWIPPRLMDREPALRFGASPVRRAVLGRLSMQAQAAAGGMRFAVEHLRHQHRYPTLVDAQGEHVPDRADRTTVMTGGARRIAEVPVQWLAIWQGHQRSHAGADYRHPASLTRRAHGNGVVAQASSAFFRSPALRLHGTLGVGLRSDTWDARATGPVVSDLLDEWTWMHRPQLGEELTRGRVDANLHARLGADGRTRLWLHGGHGVVRSRVRTPAAGWSAVSFQRARDPAHRSVSMTRVQADETAREWLTDLRLEASHARKVAGFDLRGVAALDYAATGSRSGPTLGDLAPAFGMAAVMPIGGASLFALVRREPGKLTSQVTRFIDPARPSGQRYRWNDDGDGIPQPGEAGELLARVGGDSHALAAGLGRPSSNQLAFGWQSPTMGPFRAVVSGIFHVLLDRYRVVMSGPAAASYTETSVGAVVGTDLADRPLDEQDLELPVYVRQQGTEGEEVYTLSRVRRPAAFFGSEIQLLTDPGRWWFFNLAATGYWSRGTTPFGLFAERNDTGVISEVSADPNHRLNGRGSVDGGRAFHINVMAGIRPRDGLSAALVLRYRDGEPMTRMAVVEDLPQGPTTLMALPRGDPIPRYTFHMTLDCRLRYERELDSWRAAVVLDGYNLLGSGTEILEDVASGPSFRRSLEMMPGRAFMLGIELGYL